MRKLVIVFLTGMLSLGSVSFSQDNIYGDYLLAGYDKPISLDLEGAHLVDVLKMLSKQSGMNFISTEAIRDRRLTLYLEDVPLREALDIIFKANHLAYDYYPDSNMFVVKEMGKPDLELKTKTYYLRYVHVDSARIKEDIDNFLSSEQAQSRGEGSDQATGTEEKKDGIKVAVESVLTEFGKFTVDPVTNSLTVVDVPSRFPLIDEVISQLDVALPTVMIEVEMLDVSKNTADLLGVKWPSTLAALDMTLNYRATQFPFGGTKFADAVANSTYIFSQSNPTPGGITDATWSFNNFGPNVLTVVGTELALQFLRTQTDTRFLARPKIMTVANQPAIVNITTKETIGGTISTQVTGQETFSPEREDTGTSLRVTPQVDEASGEITLFVDMNVSAAKTSNFAFTGNAPISGGLKDPEKRRTSAVVRLKQGQTLFMGGLIKTDKTDIETKVPLLGDIPVIGRAFRHRDKQEEERELMVFITPRLIKDGTIVSSAPGTAALAQREQLGSSRRKNVKLALDAFTR